MQTALKMNTNIIIATEKEFKLTIPYFKTILEHGNEILFINTTHECHGLEELIHSPTIRSTYSFIKINILLKKTAMNFLIKELHKYTITYNLEENLTSQFICPNCMESTM